MRVFYRHQKQKDTHCSNDLKGNLKILSKENKKILTGDFNLNLLKFDNFLELLSGK